MKITAILWKDNQQNIHFSIAFGGLIYHIISSTNLLSIESIENYFGIDLGIFLTELMYCGINENEEYEKGALELLEDFNPFEIIEKEDFRAKYLRKGIVGEELMTESAQRIYEN